MWARGGPDLPRTEGTGLRAFALMCLLVGFGAPSCGMGFCLLPGLGKLQRLNLMVIAKASSLHPGLSQSSRFAGHLAWPPWRVPSQLTGPSWDKVLPASETSVVALSPNLSLPILQKGKPRLPFSKRSAVSWSKAGARLTPAGLRPPPCHSKGLPCSSRAGTSPTPGLAKERRSPTLLPPPQSRPVLSGGAVVVGRERQG